MELSIIVARILALTYICSGIAAFTGKLNFNKILENFENSPGLTYITGFITLAFGVILVTYHNFWIKDWLVVITIVGWLSLIKGMLIVLFPKFMFCFKGIYKHNKSIGLIILLIGIGFGYLSLLFNCFTY